MRSISYFAVKITALLKSRSCLISPGASNLSLPSLHLFQGRCALIWRSLNCSRLLQKDLLQDTSEEDTIEVKRLHVSSMLLEMQYQNIYIFVACPIAFKRAESTNEVHIQSGHVAVIQVRIIPRVMEYWFVFRSKDTNVSILTPRTASMLCPLIADTLSGRVWQKRIFVPQSLSKFQDGSVT